MTLTEKRLCVRLKSVLLTVALGLAALSLDAFSAPAAEKAAEKQAVIRMDFIIGGKHAIWYVAWDKGFYSKRGLSVTIQPGSGSADTVRAIAAGLTDVGFADFPTAIVARSSGASVQAAGGVGYVPGPV